MELSIYGADSKTGSHYSTIAPNPELSRAAQLRAHSEGLARAPAIAGDGSLFRQIGDSGSHAVGRGIGSPSVDLGASPFTREADRGCHTARASANAGGCVGHITMGAATGDLGPPVLALAMRRFGYDYFMRLHDMSMLLTVGELSGFCDGVVLPSGSGGGGGNPKECVPVTVPFSRSPMLLGSTATNKDGSLSDRPRMSAIECGELFRKLDVDGDGRVSLAELQTLCKKDVEVMDKLGLSSKAPCGSGGCGADEDPIEALFRALDADGSQDVEYEEFAKVFCGGSALEGGLESGLESSLESSAQRRFSALPAAPRLAMAERRWVSSSGAKGPPLDAVQEDFLQVRSTPQCASESLPDTDLAPAAGAVVRLRAGVASVCGHGWSTPVSRRAGRTFDPSGTGGCRPGRQLHDAPARRCQNARRSLGGGRPARGRPTQRLESVGRRS